MASTTLHIIGFMISSAKHQIFASGAVFFLLSFLLLDRVVDATGAFHYYSPPSFCYHSTWQRHQIAPKNYYNRETQSLFLTAAEYHEYTDNNQHENSNLSRSDNHRHSHSFQESFFEMRRRYHSRIRSLEKEVATLKKQQFTVEAIAGKTLELSNLDLPTDLENLDVFAGRNNETHDNNDDCDHSRRLEPISSSTTSYDVGMTRQFQEFQLEQVKRKIKLLEREITLLRRNSNDTSKFAGNRRVRERKKQIMDQSQDEENGGASESTFWGETMALTANETVHQVAVASSILNEKNEIELDFSKLGEKSDESKNDGDEANDENTDDAIVIENKRAVFVGYRYTETEWRSLASAHPEDG